LQAEQNQSNPLADQQFAPNLISLVSLLFHPVLPKFGAKMVTPGIKVLCHVNCHRLRMRWLLLATQNAAISNRESRSDFQNLFRVGRSRKRRAERAALFVHYCSMFT